MPSESDLDKFHPNKNSMLFGHDHAEKALLSAFTQLRLPHAWVFSGPLGIGKATLAYRFARFILVNGNSTNLLSNIDTLDVPENHPIFRRIAAKSHPDLKVIEPTYDKKKGRLRGEIVVDDIRGLCKFFSMKAAEGNWRVAIIDSADAMNRNAANALLKTLEEPPKNSILMLINHNTGNLPATLRSRCRRLFMHPLPSLMVAKSLSQKYPNIPDYRKNKISLLADGSPGRAIACIASSGLELYEEIATLLYSIPSMDMISAQSLSDRLSVFGKDGDEFYLASILLRRWLERMIRYAASGDSPKPIIDGEREMMATLVYRISIDRWFELLEKVCNLLAAAEKLNLDRRNAILTIFSSLQWAFCD